jgi:selenoprotein W-related protein
LTAQLLLTFKQKLAGLTLVPASGGCFEITINGQLAYSKLATGQFPAESEVVALVRAAMV